MDVGTAQWAGSFAFACCLNALRAEGMLAAIQRRAVFDFIADGAWLLSVLQMLVSLLRSGLLLDVLNSILLQPMLLFCHSFRHDRQSRGRGRGVACIKCRIHGLEHGSNRRHVEHRPFSLDGGLDCGAEAGGRSSIIHVAGNADHTRCCDNHTSRCDRIVSVRAVSVTLHCPLYAL